MGVGLRSGGQWRRGSFGIAERRTRSQVVDCVGEGGLRRHGSQGLQTRCETWVGAGGFWGSYTMVVVSWLYRLQRDELDVWRFANSAKCKAMYVRGALEDSNCDSACSHPRSAAGRRGGGGGERVGYLRIGFAEGTLGGGFTALDIVEPIVYTKRVTCSWSELFCGDG